MCECLRPDTWKREYTDEITILQDAFDDTPLIFQRKNSIETERFDSLHLSHGQIFENKKDAYDYIVECTAKKLSNMKLELDNMKRILDRMEELRSKFKDCPEYMNENYDLQQ